MIYALVEPSIYMIASILPATRHLYRRLRRKARLTAQLQSAKDGDGSAADAARHSGGHPRSECSEVPIGLEVQEMATSRSNRQSGQSGLTFEDYSLDPQRVGWEGGREEKRPQRELVRKKIGVRERR